MFSCGNVNGISWHTCHGTMSHQKSDYLIVFPTVRSKHCCLSCVVGNISVCSFLQQQFTSITIIRFCSVKQRRATTSCISSIDVSTSINQQVDDVVLTSLCCLVKRCKTYVRYSEMSLYRLYIYILIAEKKKKKKRNTLSAWQKFVCISIAWKLQRLT